MDARTIDSTSERLGRLRRDEWERFGLSAVALALAVLAAAVLPPLAVPLLAGGVALAALGVRTCWERWALVDDLVLEADAYEIAEVRAEAERVAGRGDVVAALQALLEEPDRALAARVRAVRPQLEELASELAHTGWALEPWAAAACMRLLTDHGRSPLLNPALPASDARAMLFRIRAGLRPYCADDA